MKIRNMLVVAVTLAALGWGAAGVTASAAPAHHAAAAARLHCPQHLKDQGTSLVGLSRESKVPVAIILWFAFRCSGYQGGGWTARMARYLSAGNLHAHYYGWYWIGGLR